MDAPDQEYDVYECQSCGSLQVAGATPQCCDGEMATADVSLPYESPGVEDVVREVFGISGTGLVVCRQLMETEEATVEELADRIDRDRSVVSRHLNHLLELGVVEKEPHDVSGGGRKFVYRPRAVEQVRRQFAIGLHAWLADALTGVEELQREKIEAMAEARSESQDEAGGGVSTALEKLLGRRESS